MKKYNNNCWLKKKALGTMIQSIRRTREFTGPTPHSVAIAEKPRNNVSIEHLILEKRKKEELRQKAIAGTLYQKQCDLKSEWEKFADKKLQSNVVARRVEALLMREKISLEERRDRLRELLITEEEQYLAEMEAKEESIEDRQESMRQRAKELKEKREHERKSFVAMKLDQKFREECEELRSHQSKMKQDELFNERKTQMAEKMNKYQTEKEVEQMYAELWEQDRILKAKREEEEAKLQMERNREMVEILNLQKSAIEKKLEEERQLKQLEADWVKQEAEIRAEEEKFLGDERKRKQLAAKRARDISIKLKKKNEARERQEQLAMDMKILQKVIEDTKNEEVEDKNKKRILREENQRFMHYVQMTRKEEKDRAEKLDKLVNIEVEKQYERRDIKKGKEKEARASLLQDVLQTRREQIREREESRKKEKEDAIKERQELLKQIEEYKRLETEHLNRLRSKNRNYQEDLVQQIKFQQRKKDIEIDETRREIQSLQDAEKAYQRNLRSALEHPEKTRRQHPFRIQGVGLNSRAQTS